MAELQAEILGEVHRMLETHLPQGRAVQVLEAGGGSFSHIRLPHSKCVTLLDISPEQIERNTYADKKVLGDLEDPDALNDEYDLIVCFDVLEHLRNPGLAFGNLVQAMAAGGLLVVGCPNLFSVKGLVTRFTPHWFHVWYYRQIRGIPKAGRPGHAPFRTFLRREMASGSLERQSKFLGLEVLYSRKYVGPMAEELRQKHPLLYFVYNLPGIILSVLSLGLRNFRHTDFTLVLYRPPSEQGELGEKFS